MKPLGLKPIPPPLSFKTLLGPSFILLGLGLGSGELILWPYLVAHWGLGIIWGAVLGIAFQFFINMEIERYALVTGESVFVGLARKLGRIIPVWFLFSTLIPWVWPGIVAVSGKILGSILGITETAYLSAVLLLVIGTILTLGPVLYKTVEKLQMVLIALGVPFILGLTLYLAKSTDWQALFAGVLGQGNGYTFIPAGMALAGFLAAFAYAGAGGNLNLAQAFYIKEKGYGMGKYAGRITSVLTGQTEEIALEGNTFIVDDASHRTFQRWWRLINLEHFSVFAVIGLVTILLLALLSYATVYGQELPAGVNFVIREGLIIGQRTVPAIGTVFLLIVAVMLFATQLTVLDATSRIMAENVAILFHKHFPLKNLSGYFYSVLWIQILAGAVILFFKLAEPLTLLTLGAVLNAVSMTIYIPLVVWLNITGLHKHLRPSWWRLAAIAAAFLFFAGFTVFVIGDKLL